MHLESTPAGPAYELFTVLITHWSSRAIDWMTSILSAGGNTSHV